jgi:SNF2 family DNA or RNA helicase
MRDVQRQLKQYLEQRYALNVAMINGETSTALGSPNSRQRLIDVFQEHQGFNVIILSPLAAGVGLNIQQANHVIHYVRHWNPAREDQATDRAYRIGQTRDVTVYTPTVRGPGWMSFEETLDRLLAIKRQLAGDMLDGVDDVERELIRELSPLQGESHH